MPLNIDGTAELLDEAEQVKCLLQHVPHRLCAALADVKAHGGWEIVSPFKPEGSRTIEDRLAIYCAGRAFEEAHRAAMRWLVEFIGWTAEREPPFAPKPAPKSSPHTIIAVTSIPPGQKYPANGSHLKLLAELWAYCSKASMHPTRATDHPLFPPERLSAALAAIVAHLQAELYAPRGLDLLEVVKRQEDGFDRLNEVFGPRARIRF